MWSSGELSGCSTLRAMEKSAIQVDDDEKMLRVLEHGVGLIGFAEVDR